MSKLSIVTTTYNQEKYIKQALDSFISQKTNFPFDVIISDDCSSDTTPKIIGEYASKYPDIIKPIFNKKNLGAMENLIQTLSLVKSEYVALCDGDDYWTDDNKLQKQVDFLDANKDYSICFHKTKIFFENSEFEDTLWPVEYKQDSDLSDLLKENIIPANTVVYRWIYRNDIKLSDIFPKDIVPADYYIHLLHAEKGKIRYIDEEMSHYRRHDKGMWWLSVAPDGKDEFNIKYGKKFLNFYNEVEKHFNLDSKVLWNQKKDLLYGIINTFVRKRLIKDLKSFREENEEVFDACLNEIIEGNKLYRESLKIVPISGVDEVYYSLPKFKKVIFLLMVDKKRLFSILKNKLKRENIEN
jgi:glycosyltransferase involved in cell wall biosynthesis